MFPLGWKISIPDSLLGANEAQNKNQPNYRKMMLAWKQAKEHDRWRLYPSVFPNDYAGLDRPRHQE